MRSHFNRKQLFLRVVLLVLLMAAACLGIFSSFRDYHRPSATPSPTCTGGSAPGPSSVINVCQHLGQRREPLSAAGFLRLRGAKMHPSLFGDRLVSRRNSLRPVNDRFWWPFIRKQHRVTDEE